MICPKCGNSLIEEAQFCPNCGNSIVREIPQPVVAPIAPIQPQPIPAEPVTPTNNKSNTNIILIVIIVLAIIVAGFFGFKYSKVKKDYDKCVSSCNNKQTNNQNNNTNTNTNTNTNNNNNNNNNQNNSTSNNDTPGVNSLDLNGPFFAYVEDVFIRDGKVVVSVRAERGTIKLNEDVEIVGLKDTIKSTIIGIESYNEQIEEAKAGNYYGITLSNVSRDDIEKGQALVKPGSVTAHTKFKATIYALTKEEGGRHTPFFNNYRPEFAFGTTNVTGVVTLEDIDMVNPGDTVTITVELIAPLAMENGTKFSIREGGRTVGNGTVTELLN